jgi:hypothetical protein
LHSSCRLAVLNNSCRLTVLIRSRHPLLSNRRALSSCIHSLLRCCRLRSHCRHCLHSTSTSRHRLLRRHRLLHCCIVLSGCWHCLHSSCRRGLLDSLCQHGLLHSCRHRQLNRRV